MGEPAATRMTGPTSGFQPRAAVAADESTAAAGFTLAESIGGGALARSHAVMQRPKAKPQAARRKAFICRNLDGQAHASTATGRQLRKATYPRSTTIRVGCCADARDTHLRSSLHGTSTTRDSPGIG